MGGAGEQPADGLSVDWHCHTPWSDGRSPLAAVHEAAAARGVAVGISDHALRDNRRLRTAQALDQYLAELASYPVFRGVEISVGDLGAALDGSAPDPADYAAILRRLEQMDYVIASLHGLAIPDGIVQASHYLNWRAGMYPSYEPSLRGYSRRHFFDAWLTSLEATARRWPVRILGHFCLLPELATEQTRNVTDSELEPDEVALEWLDATIDLCCRYDIAIELNCKSRVPDPSFVSRAAARGASFSLGSDAHDAERAGDLAYGRNLLRALNVPAGRVLGASAVRAAV